MNGVYISNKNNLENLAGANSTTKACVTQYGNIPVPGNYTNQTLNIFQQVEQNQQFLIQYNTTAYLNYARVQVFDMVSVIENCYSSFVINQNNTVLNDCVGDAVKNTDIAVQSTLNYLNRPFNQMRSGLIEGNKSVIAVAKGYLKDSEQVLSAVFKCIGLK
ncbi:hypothetical protein ACFFRR_008444 [Megaselia abdita]